MLNLGLLVAAYLALRLPRCSIQTAGCDVLLAVPATSRYLFAAVLAARSLHAGCTPAVPLLPQKAKSKHSLHPLTSRTAACQSSLSSPQNSGRTGQLHRSFGGSIAIKHLRGLKGGRQLAAFSTRHCALPIPYCAPAIRHPPSALPLRLILQRARVICQVPTSRTPDPHSQRRLQRLQHPIIASAIARRRCP